MKISSVSNCFVRRSTSFKPNTYEQNNQNKRLSILTNNNLGRDLVSFKCALCCDDFSRQYLAQYQGQSLRKTIPSIVANPENYINEGKSCVVYSIPGIERYVLRVPIPVEKYVEELSLDENKTFHPVEDTYPNRNYGQAVLENRNGIRIIKMMSGEAHSLKKWVYYMENPHLINHEMARQFLSQMSIISEFPQETFDKYALAVKRCNKNKMDTINPNNTMIDSKKQKIGIIDISDESVINGNTREDMIFPLVDIFLHKVFYSRLTPEEQSKLVEATKIIIEKCNIAGDKAVLQSNERSFKAHVIKKVQAVSRNPEFRIKKFQEMYNDTMSLYRDDIYGSNDWFQN